jgi:hypothetical protein
LAQLQLGLDVLALSSRCRSVATHRFVEVQLCLAPEERAATSGLEERGDPSSIALQVCTLLAETVVSSLSISGAECVAALCLAGFRVCRSPRGATVLMREGRIVVVPDAFLLSSDVLDALLEEANLSHDRFLWLLSEATTQPDLPVLEG